MSGTEVTFGRELARLRTERGFSLEKISRDIKVRKSIIEALENGDTAKLPHRIFVRGYIKAYADRLGVDASPLLEGLEALYAGRESCAVFSGGDADRRGNPLRWIIGSLLVMGAGVLIVWWIGWGRKTEPALPAPVGPKLESPALNPVRTPPTGTPAVKAVAEARTSTPPAPAKPIAGSGNPVPPLTGLLIRCGEDCWIEVSSGGKRRAARLMKPGDELKLPGVSFTVTVGNVPGAKLFYNGRAVTLPAGSGKVLKDFRIPPLKGTPTDG